MAAAEGIDSRRAEEMGKEGRKEVPAFPSIHSECRSRAETETEGYFQQTVYSKGMKPLLLPSTRWPPTACQN